MAYIDTNRPVLEIINVCMKRLGLDAVSTIDQNSLSIVAVDLLNDVVTDMCDYFQWPQLYAETSVVAVSSVVEYKINVDAKSISEVSVSGQVSPLELVTIEDIRRLNRITSSGIPRQFAIIKVSGDASYMRVHPTPVTPLSSFEVAYYTKPRLVRASAGDGSLVFNLPARVLIQGLYAQMLLEESGGRPTPEVAAASQLYAKMKQDSLNRFTFDTGSDVYIVPAR